MNMNETGESSSNQDCHFISASRMVLPEFSGVYINPKQSISEEELQQFQMDSNSETPDRYPHAPQTSPIDIKSYQDSAVFEAKLRECLRNLPNILLSSEERLKEESPERLRFLVENPIRSNIEVSTPIDLEVRSDMYKEFEDYFENIHGTCSKVPANTPISIHLACYGNNESAETFPIAGNYHMEKLDLLRVDSDFELNTDLYRRSTLSDKESMIANWGSDASDISTEDECESDDDSSTASRDRIEFEALAIDSVVNPNIIQRLQQWKIRGKNKRAHSLDDIIPSKILHTTDFSKAKFELNI